MSAPEPASSLEFELTYLAREIPQEIHGVQPVVMEDTYIPEDLAVHPHMRIRRKNDRYEITKKLPVTDGDGSLHMEHTLQLDRAEYDTLRDVTARKVLKERYKVSLDGHEAEVDVFRGPLTGLVLIDFEFNSAEEKSTFNPPKCCLVEVTQKEFLAGGMLSGRTYEDIASDLESLGYTRLEVPESLPS